MIRNLKLFAACVESMRTAEREYAKHPTPRNHGIMVSLQNKVDGWLTWIRNQQESQLLNGKPPFIGIPRHESQGNLNKGIMSQLMDNHSPKEIESFIHQISGKK